MRLACSIGSIAGCWVVGTAVEERVVVVVEVDILVRRGLSGFRGIKGLENVS